MGEIGEQFPTAALCVLLRAAIRLNALSSVATSTPSRLSGTLAWWSPLPDSRD